MRTDEYGITAEQYRSMAATARQNGYLTRAAQCERKARRVDDLERQDYQDADELPARLR